MKQHGITTQSLQILTTEGTPIAVEVAGSGDRALVFVHGWAGQGAFWWPQLAHFAETHRVVTLDISGHGRSGLNPAGHHLGGFARDTGAVIESLDLLQCVLIGHSMGGAVILEAARRMPQRVTRVVMVDAFVMDWGRLDEVLVEGFLASFREDFSGAVLNLIEQGCTPDTDPAVIERAAQVMTSLSPEVGLPALESLLRWDPLPTFEALRVPVDCINGALVNPDARARYAPFVTEYPIAGAGHYLQFEDAKGFNQLLEQILLPPE